MSLNVSSQVWCDVSRLKTYRMWCDISHLNDMSISSLAVGHVV